MMRSMDTVWLLEALTPLFEKGEPQTCSRPFCHEKHVNGIILFSSKTVIFHEKKDCEKFDAGPWLKRGGCASLMSHQHNS